MCDCGYNALLKSIVVSYKKIKIKICFKITDKAYVFQLLMKSRQEVLTVLLCDILLIGFFQWNSPAKKNKIKINMFLKTGAFQSCYCKDVLNVMDLKCMYQRIMKMHYNLNCYIKNIWKKSVKVSEVKRGSKRN